MITDIENRKEEVKKIWLEQKNKKIANQIYKKFLGNYFDIENYSIKHTDWLFFMNWVKEWKQEIKDVEDQRRADNLTDEDIDDIQNANRKRMILIMEGVLKKYEENPKKMKDIPIEEIRKLYKAIQSIEESIKRTKIAKGKLGLDTAKALLLPYQRMPMEELFKLKEKLNESINRIIEIKAGRVVDGAGQDSLNSG